MTIRYREPTPLDTDLVCRATGGAVTGRRFTVHSVITAADDETVLADADATYVLMTRPAEPSRP
jgi:acyl-CoA thioesterase FadM